jgi:hypothetical protein
MTVLALTVALMSGGLLQERQPPPQLHLVDTATLEFVAGGLLRANSDLDVMSLQQLQAERDNLEDNRRSLVVPIVLLSIGAASVIVGTVLLYTFDLGLILIGAGLYVAGGVLLVVGAIVLITAIVSNAKTSSRLRRVEDRINSFNAPPPPMGNPGQPGDVPPPPPPMPAPASGWSVPQTDFVLAQF